MIVKIDLRKELPFKKGKVNVYSGGYNEELFIKWFVGRLTEIFGKIPEGKKFDVTKVKVNEKNDNYIAQHMNPWQYLILSPSVNPNLKDNEMEIDKDSIFMEVEE